MGQRPLQVTKVAGPIALSRGTSTASNRENVGRALEGATPCKVVSTFGML